MAEEIFTPVPEAENIEVQSDMLKGAGATLLTIGAATFANYGISFVLDYADRRVDDPAVIVPLIGSAMIMAVGKRMMDFAESRIRRQEPREVVAPAVNEIFPGNTGPSNPQ